MHWLILFTKRSKLDRHCSLSGYAKDKYKNVGYIRAWSFYLYIASTDYFTDSFSSHVFVWQSVVLCHCGRQSTVVQCRVRDLNRGDLQKDLSFLFVLVHHQTSI